MALRGLTCSDAGTRADSACVYLSVTVLQLLLLRPGVVKPDSEPPTLKSLVSDPYILVAAGRPPIHAPLESDETT